MKRLKARIPYFDVLLNRNIEAGEIIEAEDGRASDLVCYGIIENVEDVEESTPSTKKRTRKEQVKKEA